MKKLPPHSLIGALWLAFALFTNYVALNSIGPLVFIVPGALAFGLFRLSGRIRILAAVVWGVLFTAIFHRWALSYGFLAWVGLSLARGLPWGLLAAASLIPGSKSSQESVGWRELLSVILGYALVCFALLVGITGNDWESPAAALAYQGWFLSTLPWLGLTLSSLLVGSISILIFCGPTRARLTGVALLAGWVGLGSLTAGSGRKLDKKIALIQTGWSQEKKWDDKERVQAVERLVSLTTEGAEKGAQLIVWPETAWPYRGLRRRFSDTRKIGRLARRLKVQLLASSIEETEDGHWYNSVSRITPSGRFSHEYQKIRLAPFAEYIPLPPAMEQALRKIPPLGRISRYLPGQQDTPWELEELRYSVLICFESQVPWMVAKRQEEVDFFVVVTNDAPLLGNGPKESHFRSAILRAAQFQRPFVQASNNGVTGVVDANGRVVERTPTGFDGPGVWVVEI